MQLETYISDLLYRYECVTVPNLGAFLSQHVSATVHESTNAFYPPKKRLSFNQQIQTSDGLLANYIAGNENITFEEASKKIASRVKSIRFLLNEGKTVKLKNIGELVLNEEEKIQFNPSYNLNYLKDAFGLSQFVSPSVTRVQKVIKEEHVEVQSENEDIAPVVITAPEQRKSSPYFKYAAVALIALTVGGLITSNYYFNGIETHNQLAQEEVQKQLDNKIQEATFVISNPLPAATLNVNKQTEMYHIVAGAFRIEENSDKKVAQLVEQGYKARKVGVNKYGLHQVAYSSHPDREAAIEALNIIKSSNDPNAWLLVKQLD